MKKTLKAALFILIIGGVGYAFKDTLRPYFQNLIYQYRPCQTPITYSLGNFDSKFGISQTDFLKDISQAVIIWDSPVNKQLFKYADSGGMKINLVYDYRQAATAKLQSLGLVIHDDESTFNNLKSQYNAMQSQYTRQKADLQTQINNYNAQKQAYETQIAYWNKRGGAPQTEYNKLQQKKTSLDGQAASINQAQNNLNGLVDNINALVTVLNKLVNELNLQASSYNSIGTQRGDEFEEGLYKSSGTSKEIDIYEFDNQAKLVRVLAHELGHALGLEHIDNPDAIMYKLNQGKNDKLTADDIAALKALCKIK